MSVEVPIANWGGGRNAAGNDLVVLIKRLHLMPWNYAKITRLGNRGVGVRVFGSKCCVFLAVCGQIWQKLLGTYDLRSS